MKRYKFEKVMYDRWAVWYMEFPKNKGNRLGVYRIIDLYSGTRESRFAFRYKPRKNQTQELSDSLILGGVLHNFYKNKNMFRGTRSVEE